MKISVVIPTYNGAQKVVNLLRKLEQQTYTEFETIVIIDGSNDRTHEILHSMKFGLKNLKVVFQENKGRAGARNSGAELANGDILLFIDDDITPVKNFVESHLNAQKQHKVVVGFLEPVIHLVKKEVVAYSDYNNKKWNSDLIINKQDSYYITACNFSINKSIFDIVNGFDARLRDAEDFDLAIRLKEQGYKIYYEPKAIGYHILPSTFAETMKRAGEYGRAQKALMKVNPTAAAYFSKGLNKIEPYKKPVFYLFSFTIWIKMADNNILAALPKKIRFKIYDIMMTAHNIFK